jgi:iron(III) transport system permease protein
MKKLPPYWIIAAVIIAGLLALFLYYPVLFILEKAFFPVKGFSLAFFGILFQNRVMVDAVGTSFILGIVVTIGCLLVSLPLAWFATRYLLKGQWFFNSLLMLPMILPPFVGAIGMKQFLARFGTLNVVLMDLGIIHQPIDWLGSGFWGVAILEILHLFPIVYLNLTAALANIDPAMEEAAWNLGSTGWAFVRKILAPLAAPGIFAGAAIVFIWSTTDLGTPLILDFRGVAAYQIFGMVNDINENPMGYALVVFVLAWIGLIYYTAKKFFASTDIATTNKAMRLSARPRPSTVTAVCATLVFLAVGFVSMVPHLMVVLSACSEKWFMTVLPEHFTFHYFVDGFNHPLTVLSVRNSLFLSGLTTVADILIGIAAAYVISRFKFVGRALFDFSVMLPLALPGLILSFGYVGTFAGTILDPRTNPFPLLIAAYAVRRLPFMVRSVDAGLSQVHPSMEEASFNLGAGHTKTLTRITLPLIASSVIAGAILVFSFAMLEVSDSLILAMKENFYPITKAIYALVNRIQDGFPLASALGVFIMILLAASMLVAGKILGKKMGELFRM